MTREELRDYVDEQRSLNNIPYHVYSALIDGIDTLEQEPTTKNDLGVDAVSRDVVKEQMIMYGFHAPDMTVTEFVEDLPPVTPQEPRKGEWLRMSDLSEQEDDRYKCSRCGNVIHHKNKMDLYTFNSWCGRCGSDNGRHISYEVEE